MWIRSTLRQIALPAALAAAAPWLSQPALAQCDELTDRWERVEINLGSGVVAPIVENVGQLSDGVVYGAVGATGTAARFHANGRLDLVVSLETDFARIGFEPVGTDGVAALEPTEPLYGSVVYFGAEAPGELAAWGGLEAQDLYGSAVITHRVTGRTWRMRLAGEAGDLARLALRPTGVDEITRDETSGELSMVVEGAPDHRLVLFPAKAHLGDEVTHLPFAVDDGGTLRLEGEIPEGAELETLMVFAPYFHGGDAVADGRAGFVATGVAVDAIETGAGSGRDVAMVRLAEDGRTFLGMSVLASSGDDSASGIASHAGDAYIVGTAGAEDFPVAAKGEGLTWPGPFVARLGVDGHLSGGSTLGVHGLASARDVAVDGEGRVLVSGQASSGAKDLGGMTLTASLPIDDAAPRVQYALAELDAELASTARRQTFEGPATSLPLQIQVDCEGQVNVGPPALAAGFFNCLPRWNTYNYPSQPNWPGPWWYYDGYADQLQSWPLTDSWGYHALKWKSFSGNASYDAAAAASNLTPWVPIQQVAYLDNVRLNALEANAQVFPNGNPAGTWLRNDAYNYLELVLGAASYLEFWGSPTYANLRYDAANGGTFLTGAVGITEVEFCSNPASSNGGRGPIDLCQQQACTTPPCRYPIDDWDDVCASDPQINDTSQAMYLNSLVYTHWDTGRAGYTENEEEIYWQDVQTRFNQANPNRYYVADPPTGAEFAGAFVAEGVQRELARVVEDVRVMVTTFADGKAVASEAGYGMVRAVERMAQQE